MTKKLIYVVLVVLAAAFVSVEAMILVYGRKPYHEEADIVIILGARLYGSVPSPALSLRLDKALRYLDAHEDSSVIVSGAKGPGEDVTEAFAMKMYLVERGISPERITEEDQSTNTFENIRNSLRILGGSQDGRKLLIVSNDFHVLRAKLIAWKLGWDAGTLGSPSPPSVVVQYHLREFFGIIKSLVVDR